MLLLALDTTTASGSVALLENARLLAEINAVSASSHSARLLRSVDELLRLNSVSIKDVEGLAVAAGPGSFTGIRIGLSTAKALALASGRPVASVSTLEALAFKLRDSQARLVCPILDAKKGEVFAALFEFQAGRLEEAIPQAAYKPDRFFSALPGHRVISFIGNGAEVFQEKIFAYLKDKARFPSRSTFIAHEVGLLGYKILKDGRGKSGDDLQPLYFRRSQAEEKR
ncbi:MAG: tRNA (adenosine(37)-N6)-threonylcarbamoyltransferase complex dimerization subunit type 1 TsaB [Candidatus Aminicenantes bacterium]|nr:tRNA (adenosine(37)-N6)-threonylcarbamoyltransferase complex dimerization subunit type 1 TsaB [Candidatus Aminicenantes bacterium]